MDTSPTRVPACWPDKTGESGRRILTTRGTALDLPGDPTITPVRP